MIKTHWTFQQAHQFFLWYCLLHWERVGQLFMELHHLLPSLSSSPNDVKQLQIGTQQKIGVLQNTTQLVVVEVLEDDFFDLSYVYLKEGTYL